MDPRVRSAIQILRAATEQGRSADLRRLSASLNLSPSRFRHLFKAETGVAPAQYLRQMRLEEAKRLIETTFLSVKQVRSGVGVNDESHFARDFKRVYGRSPKKHRAYVLARD